MTEPSYVTFRIAACLFALTFALLPLAGCTVEPELLPVPKLPDGPVQLRVAYVVNPRFLQSKEEDLQRVLESARQVVKAHFKKDVTFTGIDVVSIDILFDRVAAKAASEAWKSSVYDYRNGGDRAGLKEAFEKDLRKTGDDLEAMIDFARPFLVQDVTARSFGALTDALIATQLARLGALAKQPAPDGRAILDGSPYSEWIYWDSLGYMRVPYEVLITNQLIASVEYAGNSVHSALRGGITNGLTTPNGASRLGTTAVLSVYPFVSEDPVVSALRGQETYPPEEAARFAGVVLAHELGHQLFHLGHPYGRTACVMNPTQLLRFREWVSRLAPQQCPIADSGAMKPGFAKFRLLVK